MPTITAPERTYEIFEVAQLTGLDPARLRVWERRYAVVRPRRQENRYRAYTAEQVALLRAFARLCAAGERIGDLVREPRDRVITRAERLSLERPPFGALMDAIRAMDRERLTGLLRAERGTRSAAGFGREIVLPLSDLVGDQWALGRLSVACEHLASEVVVPLLKQELTRVESTGPTLLAACFPGERHEWGLLVTLIELSGQGWRVEYLGADLPFDQVVEAAWTVEPEVVALSSSDPENVGRRLAELRGLHRLLPAGTTVVLGGEGAAAHRAALHRARFRVGLEELPPLHRGAGAA